MVTAGLPAKTEGHNETIAIGPGGTLPEEWGPTVTVIRKNWGTRHIPQNKLDYLDRIEFRDGVARDVPKEVVEGWLKVKRLGIFALRDSATDSDFIKATGVTPMDPQQFAAMINAFSEEELAAILGEERSIKLSEGLRRALGLKASNNKK